MLTLHTQDPPAPLSGHLPMGSGAGALEPLQADSRRLTRGSESWLPVMGEFHFSRYPAAEWREELLKIRAGGVDLLATYLFWNQHEENRGTLRFDGALDIRHFVELCGELGLYVAVRLGPWSHGECRNGGFPDWLMQEKCSPRTDDPAYLALVEPYYARIAQELRGLSYDQGGPIVAVQVENELYDQPEHLRTLRAMAERVGITAPLWTATGWGAADIPADVLLPLYGGYPEAFWEDAHEGWTREMRRHYFFTPIRDDHAIGADLRSSAPGGTGPDDRRYPYATCELGGGMAIAYHRRPLVPAIDVSSLALTKLGSGSAWQGYYLYHGCSQRLDHAQHNQESHDTGYPNDLPVVTYDFQAPLGEYGQVRPSYAALRMQHLLIRDSGAALAGMPLHLPDDGPAGLDDRASLRWSVRAQGDQGFLFVNNHQPHEPLPDHDGVRFQVHLGGRTVTLPAQEVNVPSGAHFVWPLGYEAGRGVRIEWASAQPLTRLELDTTPVSVFTATAGITPQFALPAGNDVSGPVRVENSDAPEHADQLVVSVPEPGTDAVVTATGPEGTVTVSPSTTVVTLPSWSNRCRAPAFAVASYAIVPAHMRPRVSHTASFIRLRGCGGRSGTSVVLRRAPSAPRRAKPVPVAARNPSAPAMGETAPRGWSRWARGMRAASESWGREKSRPLRMSTRTIRPSSRRRIPSPSSSRSAATGVNSLPTRGRLPFEGMGDGTPRRGERGFSGWCCRVRRPEGPVRRDGAGPPNRHGWPRRTHRRSRHAAIGRQGPGRQGGPICIRRRRRPRRRPCRRPAHGQRAGGWGRLRLRNGWRPRPRV